MFRYNKANLKHEYSRDLAVKRKINHGSVSMILIASVQLISEI